MFIKLSDNHAIKTDRLNYVFCNKTKITDKYPDGWKGKWYYPTLRACYNDLLEELTKIGERETLKENLEETVALLKKLRIEATAVQK